MVISLEDIRRAAYKSFEHHGTDRRVIAFKGDFDRNVGRIYAAVASGDVSSIIKFVSLTRTNTNGKRRNIDSPSLDTRIIELAWLDKVRPLYDKANESLGVTRNCLPGHGITAKKKEYSVLHDLKHLFYDRRDLHLVLVLDQRHCYEHVTVALYRKAMKRLFALVGMAPDKELIDFGEAVCFVSPKKLPIGTPTSPYIHNIIMIATDMLMRECARFALRYADDCLMAFDSKADLQAAKWRIMNLWWYVYHIRAKRHGVKIVNIDHDGLDFCGNILHRIPGKTVSDHDKGYVTVRRSTVRRAKKATPRSWPCYFGLLRHADTYRLMTEIEDGNMKLSQLTQKIKIERKMDARHMEMTDVAKLPVLTVYDYEIRQNKGVDNWIKCLIGTPEMDTDGYPTGKELAFEFHGNYQGIIQWIRKIENIYPNQSFLPIEDARIENQCGYIFEGSSNMEKYIKDSKQ